MIFPVRWSELPFCVWTLDPIVFVCMAAPMCLCAVYLGYIFGLSIEHGSSVYMYITYLYMHIQNENKNKKKGRRRKTKKNNHIGESPVYRSLSQQSALNYTRCTHGGCILMLNCVAYMIYQSHSGNEQRANRLSLSFRHT